MEKKKSIQLKKDVDMTYQPLQEAKNFTTMLNFTKQEYIAISSYKKQRKSVLNQYS
jgi:hypothetical protein